MTKGLIKQVPLDNHSQQINWHQICRLLLLSRTIDELEETELVPAKKIYNQFSARGHDFAQILLGSLMNHPHDAAAGYYRSRPFVLSLGLSTEDAIAAPLAKSGSYSDGRDIGVVCNFPNKDQGCTLFPMCGGVGTQYTPISGWAQAIKYHSEVLLNADWLGAVALSMGGDASMSTNGFWSALNISTTNQLPHLFYIEDNGYGISVPAEKQTPGGDYISNLSAYKNLRIIQGDGTDPEITPGLIKQAVDYVRQGQGTCLLCLKVPRLNGHTYQDTQVYKPEYLIAEEQNSDPLPKLQQYLLKHGFYSQQSWQQLESEIKTEVQQALIQAQARPDPDPKNITRHVFFEEQTKLQLLGGLATDKHVFPPSNIKPARQQQRINMLTAIRMTLDYELETNNKLLVFGEDVGPKGGVHGATLGLTEKHGDKRVFDTSLSEEGIIGRSVGLALAGLMPVPEIQFRKYAEPAAEQLTDTGTMRWRTFNKFAAPMVVRVPGGFAKRGDPWHSMCDEVEWAHKVGWQIAMPSNAEDAVGLLRYALRNNNPTIFFEHRFLLDDVYARRPYPGDDFIIPFGKANIVTQGNKLTVISWGAMVQRSIDAASGLETNIEVIDLRTIQPWDKYCVFNSIQKTGRCLIVHEDNKTAGFGAEIAAVIADELFFELDAPIKRLTMPDIPNPHNINLLRASVPNTQVIKQTMMELLSI